MKDRALRTMRVWSGNRPLTVDPRDLGVNISTHCRRCSCWMCQPASEVPQRRERAFYHLDAG